MIAILRPARIGLAAAILATVEPSCDHDQARRVGDVATLLDVAACGILEAIVDPGPQHDEIGHVCSVSRPLIQSIVDAIGSAHALATMPETDACEGGAAGHARRHHRHPLRHRGAVIGHIREDWAAQVQAGRYDRQRLGVGG